MLSNLRLGELLVDGHELDLSVLVNVLPRVRVVGTIPDDLRTTAIDEYAI